MKENKFPFCLSQTESEFSVESKNIPAPEPTLESMSAAFCRPRLLHQVPLKMVAHSFRSHLDSFSGLVVPTASGLEMKIPKDAGAFEGLTQQVAQCRCSHHLRAQKSLLRTAAAHHTLKLASACSVCQGRHLSQPFITSSGIHRPWGQSKAGQARALCQEAAQEATLSTVIWQLFLAGAKDRIRYPRPTAGTRNLAERLAKALTTTGP